MKQCHGLHDDPKEKARHEWLGIQQGAASILQYNQEFDRLLAVIGMEYPQDIARATMYKRGLNMHIVQRLGGLPDSRTWNLVTWQKNARTLDSNQSIWYVKKEYVRIHL